MFQFLYKKKYMLLNLMNIMNKLMNMLYLMLNKVKIMINNIHFNK